MEFDTKVSTDNLIDILQRVEGQETPLGFSLIPFFLVF